MLANCKVYRYSVKKSFLATCFRDSALEGGLAVSTRSVSKSTCKACIDSFHNLQDFRGRQFGDSTMPAKQIVLIAETLEGAGAARFMSEGVPQGS